MEILFFAMTDKNDNLIKNAMELIAKVVLF
jgi:hypothetical protein